jgi:hypothetical protein
MEIYNINIENFPSRAELYDYIKEFNRHEKNRIAFSDKEPSNILELICYNKVKINDIGNNYEFQSILGEYNKSK